MRYAALILLLWVPGAFSGEHWQLSLSSYPASEGDRPDHFLGTFRIDGGKSQDECEKLGRVDTKYFQAGLVEASPTRPVFFCDPL